MLAVLADCSRLELVQLKRIGRKVAAVYTVMERDAVTCFGHVDAAVALPDFRVAAWLHELFDATRAAVRAAAGSGVPLLRAARYSLPATSTPSLTSSSPSLPHPGLDNSFASPTTQQDITHHADTIPFPPGTYDPSAPRGAHLFIPTSLFPIPSRTRSATPESLIPSSSSFDATQHHDHDSQSPISLGRVAPSAEDLPSSQSDGGTGCHQTEVGRDRMGCGLPLHINLVD
ncbi:hypothetical protein BCR44DRAFT_59350 [Catenaria anguillulae PL171]|uniref:Uncharacterized protein n=1 Tax=Catenaria anguillulae PL171 TaxID=765915 RepID=A0A1Y2I2B6_9FUNG|nr:hypothetical protein BCR44DRAFT_59350 [Catenaria anguillulae PL171]